MAEGNPRARAMRADLVSEARLTASQQQMCSEFYLSTREYVYHTRIVDLLYMLLSRSNIGRRQ
jgi:hypothetical protein